MSTRSPVVSPITCIVSALGLVGALALTLVGTLGPVTTDFHTTGVPPASNGDPGSTASGDGSAGDRPEVAPAGKKQKRDGSVSFAVRAVVAGLYTADVHYANPGRRDQPVIMTSGHADTRQISLPPTSGSDRQHRENIVLPAGRSELVFTPPAGQAARISGLDLELPAAAPQGLVELEDGDLAGPAFADNSRGGFTGRGFVAGLDRGGAVTVYPMTAGAGTVTLRYANGTGTSRSLTLFAGSKPVQRLVLPPTAGWNTYSARTDRVRLAAGEPLSYRVTTHDTGGVHLDSARFALTPEPTATVPAPPPAGTPGPPLPTTPPPGTPTPTRHHPPRPTTPAPAPTTPAPTQPTPTTPPPATPQPTATSPAPTRTTPAPTKTTTPEPTKPEPTDSRRP